jgi:hypothetical protein
MRESLLKDAEDKCIQCVPKTARRQTNLGWTIYYAIREVRLTGCVSSEIASLMRIIKREANVSAVRRVQRLGSYDRDDILAALRAALTVCL